MLIAVLAVGLWVLAVAVVLRANHRLNVTPPAPVDVLPEAPVWVWTQARVDAQFRAITLPLAR